MADDTPDTVFVEVTSPMPIRGRRREAGERLYVDPHLLEVDGDKLSRVEEVEADEEEAEETFSVRIEDEEVDLTLDEAAEVWEGRFADRTPVDYVAHYDSDASHSGLALLLLDQHPDYGDLDDVEAAEEDAEQQDEDEADEE